MINSIQRDQRRRILVLKYQTKRVQYKTLLQNCKISLQSNKKQLLLRATKERCFVPGGTSTQAHFSQKKIGDLHRPYTSPKMPRNGSAIRVRNRCILTARGRGVLRFCKLSRIRLREFAAQGALNGVSKASW